MNSQLIMACDEYKEECESLRRLRSAEQQMQEWPTDYIPFQEQPLSAEEQDPLVSLWDLGPDPSDQINLSLDDLQGPVKEEEPDAGAAMHDDSPAIDMMFSTGRWRRWH